jgi:hypothetical protein
MTREEAEKLLISREICRSYNLGCFDCYYALNEEIDCGITNDKIDEAIEYLKEQIRIDNINKEEFR